MEGSRRPAGAGPGDATPGRDDELAGERTNLTPFSVATSQEPGLLAHETVAGVPMLVTVGDRQWGTKPRWVSQTAGLMLSELSRVTRVARTRAREHPGETLPERGRGGHETPRETRAKPCFGDCAWRVWLW